MFYEKKCILCLENAISNQNGITFDTSYNHSESVRGIVEQHFKGELAMLTHITTKKICNQCWDIVQSFHEFYIKIKYVHVLAFNKLRSLQEQEIAVAEIKIEAEAVDKLASAPSIKTEEAVKQLSDDDGNVGDWKSELFDSDNKCEEVKNLCLPTKKVTTAKRKEKISQVERKSKNRSRHKTSDYDEFIAQNFKLTCILCQRSLKDFKELKMHFRKAHQANGYVKCCGKKLFNRGVLVDHINVHNNPEYFKCKHCEKVLSDRSGLETHLQNFHDSKERTIYNCDKCSKSFFRRKVLARHILIHAPEEDKNVKCTQCDKKFCNQYSMKQHLALVHLNLYAKICDICGKALNGNEAFRRHQEEHAGIQGAVKKCQLCNTEHKTKYLLTRHMKTMHTEEYQTPQVCRICSKISPTLRAHKSHMDYMHTAKRHICKLCDKAFKLPRCLREHMTTHTGEVLYTCTFCSQTFNSHSNMYAHRKRKHPIEWAEKCAKRNVSTGEPRLITKDLKSITKELNSNQDKIN